MTEKVCRRCGNSVPVETFKYGKSSCYPCQKEMSREWKIRNRERVLQYCREWKAQHKDMVSEYNREYQTKNREVIQLRSSKYHTERAKTDFGFKLAKTLRTSLRYLVKYGNLRKGRSALQLLGCSMEFLQMWFKFNFETDMSFDNHGTVWHIDHTIPVSKFDLTVDENSQLCFHWTNLKPMRAKDNLRKKNRLTIEEIVKHEEMLHNFLTDLSDEFQKKYTMVEINRHSYIG